MFNVCRRSRLALTHCKRMPSKKFDSSKAILFFLIILTSFLLLGCQKRKPQVEETNTTVSKVPVRVLKIAKGPISKYIEMSSTVKAKEEVNIFPRISEEITAIFLQEGDSVKPGQIIAQLENRDYRLDLEEQQLIVSELKEEKSRLEVTLKEAKLQRKLQEIRHQELTEKWKTQGLKVQQQTSELKRSRTMLSKRLVSDEDYESQKLSLDEAKSQLEIAYLDIEKNKWERESQELSISKIEQEIAIMDKKIDKAQITLKKLQIRFDDTKVVAPIQGSITYHEIQIGQILQMNDRVCTVTNLKNLEIELGIPEKDIRDIELKQKVKVLGIAEDNPVGYVSLISPVVDQQTGTVKVEITILDKYVKDFRPGMFVTVQVIVHEKSNAILLPKKALLFEDNLPYIYLFEEGKSKKVSLREESIGFRDNRYFEIVDQIQEGDQVITVGQSGLKDGVLVEVVE